MVTLITNIKTIFYLLVPLSFVQESVKQVNSFIVHFFAQPPISARILSKEAPAFERKILT